MRKQAKTDRFAPFLSKYSNLMVTNKIIKFSIFCISIICIYQQYSINKYFDNQIVIIQPPNLKGEASVGRSFADDEYLKAMSSYVGLMFLNVGAGNARYQFSEILKLVLPSQYSVMKKKLKAKADLLERYSSISYAAFIVKNKAMIIEKDKVTFFASRKKIIGSDISQPVIYKVVIDYKIINGTFFIVDIKEVENA